MTAVDLADLSVTLEELSRRTWSDLGDGHRFNFSIGETTITDQNLLALKRKHPALAVYKHVAAEEVLTGADREWWVGSSVGWLCMVFQAKRLAPDGRYHGLTQRQPDGALQADTLLKGCWTRTQKWGGVVWPLYCLYNNWRGGWPKNIPIFKYEDEYCEPASKGDPSTFGCSIVGAQLVRQVIMSDRHERRRTLRDTYLPFSRPWFTLFSRVKESNRDILHVQRNLADCMTAFEPTASPRKQLADPPGRIGLSRGRVGGQIPRMSRNQIRTWQDPGLIGSPPDYVWDILDQNPRPRRLKSLGRRVVVLADLEAGI